MSFLYVWSIRRQQTLWLTLTTAVGGDASQLIARFKLLLARIGRAFGFKRIEYYYVQTNEGNGVLHVLMSWKSGRGRKGQFSIPAPWLWKTWEQLHGATSAKIKRFKASGSERRMARYLMSQYVAGQRGIVRHGGSYKRSFGFSLPKVWSQWKRAACRLQLNRSQLIAAWETLLRGERVDCRGRQLWLGPSGLWDEEALVGATETA